MAVASVASGTGFTTNANPLPSDVSHISAGVGKAEPNAVKAVLAQAR